MYNFAIINYGGQQNTDIISELFKPLPVNCYPIAVNSNNFEKAIEVIREPGVFQGIVFLGGEDVTPKFYKENTHYTTHCNPMRDSVEAAIYKKLTYCDTFTDNHRDLEIMKLKVGICRGAQFLNVMNRGKLVQDTTGHTKYHYAKLKDINGEEYKEMWVSSTHHQMMIPSKHRKYQLLGYAENLSRYYKNGLDEDIPMEVEPEVIFYPRTRTLCHQPHPEYMKAESDYQKYFLQTVVDALKYKEAQ